MSEKINKMYAAVITYENGEKEIHRFGSLERVRSCVQRKNGTGKSYTICEMSQSLVDYLTICKAGYVSPQPVVSDGLAKLSCEDFEWIKPVLLEDSTNDKSAWRAGKNTGNLWPLRGY